MPVCLALGYLGSAAEMQPLGTWARQGLLLEEVIFLQFSICAYKLLSGFSLMVFIETEACISSFILGKLLVTSLDCLQLSDGEFNFLPFFASIEESFLISRGTPSHGNDVCATEML